MITDGLHLHTLRGFVLFGFHAVFPPYVIWYWRIDWLMCQLNSIITVIILEKPLSQF